MRGMRPFTLFLPVRGICLLLTPLALVPSSLPSGAVALLITRATSAKIHVFFSVWFSPCLRAAVAPRLASRAAPVPAGDGHRV